MTPNASLVWMTAWLLSVPSPGPSGIRGTVHYRGPVPPPNLTLPAVNAKVCGAKGPIASEELLISASAEVANVVISVEGLEGGPKTEARLDQADCVFRPHVQSVTAGSELLIGNRDPVIHNVHARMNGETIFNLGMPTKGMKVRRRLDTPGVVSFHCDSGHTWMLAYLVVVPNGFHATTNTAGQFVIPNVPPGEYTVRAWHETLGTLSRRITILSGADTPVDLEFSPDALQKSESKPLETPERIPVQTATTAIAFLDIGEGRDLFQRHCAPCHGENGNGAGPATRWLRGHPRNFRSGDFKFRSTRSGAAPTEEDVVRSITEGIPGTAMPAWKSVLSRENRRAVARYVLSLSPHAASRPSAALVIPPKPIRDAASVARGLEVYRLLKCGQCHGEDGVGERTSTDLKDGEGRPITATDFRTGVFKSGRHSEDIFRTLMTGLSATPMPSFADSLDSRQAWDLVHFLESLEEQRPLHRTFLGF